MLKTSTVAPIAVAIFIGFVIRVVGGWSHEAAWTVDDIVLLLLSVVAVVFAVLAARAARGRQRAAWACLAVGLAGWGVGDVIWNYIEMKFRVVPFPTTADLFYLLLPVGACLAMLLFPIGRSGQSRGRMLLDGLIVAGSLFMISWVTVLGPIYAERGEGRLQFAVSLAYPVSDVVILTIAAVVLVRATSSQRLVITLLTMGLACIALADFGYVYLASRDEYAGGNLVGIGWVAGLLLITVAAAAARESTHVGRGALQLPSWASMWLPYAPFLLAAIVSAGQPRRVMDSRPFELIATVLVMAVLMRQFLAVSENRRLLAVVAEQALRDPLTGLGNRALFNQRIGKALERRERGRQSVGLVVMDLNDFKLVNDALGHPAGDALLCETAERILESVREEDTVSRLGGDEFAVLVEGSVESSNLVADRIVESFNRPFLISGQQLMVYPSVGLAVLLAGDPALSAEELLRRADVAMYSAKKSRTVGVCTFTEGMHLEDGDGEALALRNSAPADGNAFDIQLLGELRRAIELSELVLYYQPKFDLRTSRVVGVEALVRWPHPARGMLVPQDFLHLVRGHGLMWPMTELVVNRALDDAARWHAAGVDVPVAVNVFAPLLADLTLPARLLSALADRGLSGGALTVELTEDLLLGSVERTKEVFIQLRQNGIRIAVDDFGQAYSTFSYLRDLPVDEVKLDHSFVAAIVSDHRAAVVAQGVLEMSHKLGLTTVAEGVEDLETQEVLREFGCDTVQGFFYCPPLTPEQIIALLTARTSST